MLWGTILVTALLSTLLTLGALALVWQYRVRPRLTRTLNEQFEQKVQKASVEVARKVEESVRRGVREGVREGVVSLASKETLADTTRTIAKTGVGLMEGGVGMMLGRRPKRRPDGRDEQND